MPELRPAQAAYNPVDSHVYLDIPLRHDQQTDDGRNGSPAAFSATKTLPILQNSSEYHLVFSELDLNAIRMPSYVFNPANPGTVTLTYNGNTASQDLVFVYQGATPPPTTLESYYHIYDFQQWVDMVNTAFDSAFAALAATPGGSTAPRIVWDTDAEKFIVYGQKAFYDYANVALPVEIFFDLEIKTQLPFLQYYDITADQFQLRMKDNFNNTETIASVDYLAMKQQATGVDAWNAVRSIVFTSSQIPIAATYTHVGSSASSDSQTNSVKILTSFDVNVSNALDQRKRLLYEPSTVDRKIDLSNTVPLRQLDIQVQWKDRHGDLHPFYIPKDVVDGIRLLFIRKGSEVY